MKSTTEKNITNNIRFYAYIIITNLFVIGGTLSTKITDTIFPDTIFLFGFAIIWLSYALFVHRSLLK